MTDSSALAQACHQEGLRHDDARLLRAHSASVYVLPSEHAVARISRKEHPGLRAKTSVTVTRWLVSQGFPATEPLIDSAVELGDITVTLWVYYPQEGHGEPPARELGAILRQLHALPPPPFELPPYRPLAGLQLALDTPSVLREADRAWLIERAEALIEQYHQLDSHLGVGLVHGDAYTGNTLWGPRSVLLLGDWDEASIAPRELDLANTYQGVRYGPLEPEFDDFAKAYGWDIRDWNGFTVLRDMRDLHTLTGFIRRSAHEPASAAELQLRVEVLRNPEDTRIWHAAT